MATELSTLYELARRAKDVNNTKSAEKYYTQISEQDPSSWEGFFYSNYFRAHHCIIAEIPSMVQMMRNCQSEVLNLIKKSCFTDEEKGRALLEVKNGYVHIALLFISNYEEFRDTDHYTINGAVWIPAMLYAFGEALDCIFDGKYNESIAVPCWIAANQLQEQMPAMDRTLGLYNDYAQKIQAYIPSYHPATLSNSGGCYVATCVYGSYDCPQVWTLRRYRDDTLGSTWYGRLFIRTYYAISPTLVKWFGNTNWFKNMWKPTLDKMVAKLNRKGVESTPYNDKNW